VDCQDIQIEQNGLNTKVAIPRVGIIRLNALLVNEKKPSCRFVNFFFFYKYFEPNQTPKKLVWNTALVHFWPFPLVLFSNSTFRGLESRGFFFFFFLFHESKNSPNPNKVYIPLKLPPNCRSSKVLKIFSSAVSMSRQIRQSLKTPN